MAMVYKTIRVFDREYYLLGKDTDGIYYWLEQPEWCCNWYWSFGNIITFTNNANPARSNDIRSLEHANDFYPRWVLSNNSRLVETPFFERELWLLAELFNQFYLFQELAEFYYTGTTGITKLPYSRRQLAKWKDTNERIYGIIQKIKKIVTGKYEVREKRFRKRETFEKWYEKHGSQIIYYNLISHDRMMVKYMVGL